jgi:transposase
LISQKTSFSCTASTEVERSSCKALRRSQVAGFFRTLPPCLIGMEACATAHHWARTLMAFGHEVRLIPPAYVKPYLRRQKNDAADAAAICVGVDGPLYGIAVPE